MAHFRATLKGSRGGVSRCGTKGSGLTAEINGWGIGCTVVIEYDPVNKLDVIRIYKTTGSSRLRVRREEAVWSIPPEAPGQTHEHTDHHEH